MTALFCSIRGLPPVPEVPEGGTLADAHREHLALVRGTQWPNGTVLRVGFLDNPSTQLRAEIMRNLNAWSRTANISFRESRDNPQIRIARATGPQWGGYWSYLGTQCLGVPADEPTLNLEGFTTRTPASEFVRVVRHEAGHALGMMHEHLRKEIVDRIDPAKAIAYFKRTQGWSEAVIRDNVLTPVPQSAFIGTRLPDPNSIMTYWLAGQIMKDGKAVLGGSDISPLDARFAGSVYPKGTR